MKSLPSIKRVLYPSWAKLSVLAAGVCAAILVCLKTELPRNDVKVYPALPVAQSPEIVKPEAAFLPPVPTEEQMLAELKASEPEMETIPEVAPVEVAQPAPVEPAKVVVEVAEEKNEPVKLAAQKTASEKKAPSNKVASKKVSAPKKRRFKIAKAKHVKPVIEKVVQVTPPMPIVVPTIRTASPDSVLQAFAWLAAEKMTPQMAKRLKKIQENAQIERLADAGLDEQPQLDDYSQVVSAPVEMALSLEDSEIEIETRNAVRFAEFKQNQFSELKAKLKARQEALKTVAIEAPKAVAIPKLVEAIQSEPDTRTDGAARVAVLKANPEIEEELETIPEESKNELVAPAVETETKNQLVRPQELVVEGPIIAPQETTTAATPNAALDLLASGANAPSAAKAPAQTNVLVDTRKPAGTVTTQPAPPTPAKPVIHLADNSGRSSRKNLSASNYGMEAETVKGKFSVDDAMDAELTKINGHIELQLIPVAREIENQEHPVLRFSYPAADYFKIPKGLIRGNHRLYARVYKGDEAFPVATIPYHSNVNEFVRENVKFHVTKHEYDSYLNFGANVPTNDRFLYVTVAKALEGNRDEPERIKNARVRIVGYPQAENGFVNLSDGELNDGVYKLKRVPSRSEFLVEVEADGYLRTDKVVSTFGTDSKAVIYLLSNKTVEAARQWATPELPIDPEKAVVFGRDFDPRSPGKMVVGEQISMEYRNGPTVYFGNVFPDMSAKATTESGIFAFFNLVPSVRAVFRETVGKMAYLMNLRKRSGYLVDLGRGGLKSLRGQLFDTLNNLNPEALVSINRQKDGTHFETDGAGRFEVKNVDVSNDVVMLKVENDHYPTFLYPISVDARENLSRLNLFMMDQKRYDEILQDLPGGILNGKGHVLGGAEASLFSQSPDCLRIELTDAEGVKVDSKHGPFPWGGSTSTCFDQNNPRWAFKNLFGQYTARWVDKKGHTVRSHVFIVDADPKTGKGYATMVIN